MSLRHSRLTFNDLPYLTAAERGEFKRMKSEGQVTVFGLAICGAVDCEEEVPKGVKTYCSERCFQKEEGRQDDEEEAEEGWGMD